MRLREERRERSYEERWAVAKKIREKLSVASGEDLAVAVVVVVVFAVVVAAAAPAAAEYA